jgi:hypothetical protein
MADVKSPSFLIGNATVMLAPRSVDVFSLTPTLHSVGMVKAVTVGMEADTIDLRNGIQQNLVDQMRSGVRLTTSFEGYEFTGQNLLRALGYASTAIVRKRGTLTTAIAAAGTSAIMNSNPISGDATSGITAVGDIPAGSTLVIQRAAEPDYVFVTRTTGAATGSGPYTATMSSALPAGMSFAIGDIVWVVNEIDVGSQVDSDFFGMKIVGTLSANNVPVVVIFPKVKIVRGFNLNFSETDYSNLPFEISPFFLAASEATGRLAEIGTRVTGKAYIGA